MEMPRIVKSNIFFFLKIPRSPSYRVRGHCQFYELPNWSDLKNALENRFLVTRTNVLQAPMMVLSKDVNTTVSSRPRAVFPSERWGMKTSRFEALTKQTTKKKFNFKREVEFA